MDDAVIGCTGSVVVRLRGADGPGEVVVAVRGGHESFLAYAPEPIAVGTVVLVIGTHGPRAVDVEPWH